MESDRLTEVRTRTRSAGLNLDDERLGNLTDALREFSGMMDVVERIAIDPVDLALETYDPSWSEGGQG